MHDRFIGWWAKGKGHYATALCFVRDPGPALQGLTADKAPLVVKFPYKRSAQSPPKESECFPMGGALVSK